MNTPRFFYFDLGNVLVNFDRNNAFDQLSAVAGITPEQVGNILGEDNLQLRYERGELATDEVYKTFCEKVTPLQSNGTALPDMKTLTHAGSAFFELNYTVQPIIVQMRAVGQRLGILSNTCESHWEYVAKKFRILVDDFSVHTLSYQVGALKPEPAIFEKAAEKAGFAPEEIFYVDDVPELVEGAREFGFDAVLFTSADALAQELRKRNVGMNY